MSRVEDRVTPDQAKQIATQCVGRTGRKLSASSPLAMSYVNRAGQDGFQWRVQVVAPPVVDGGHTLSFRRTVRRSATLDEIEAGGGFEYLGDRIREQDASILRAAEERRFKDFLALAVAARWNILISGGTNAGKTFVANAALQSVRPEDRLVIIEDTSELFPGLPNIVKLRAEEEGREPSHKTLVKTALRLRPERIVLGELRGPEAWDFLEAANTGHPGSISTIHATTAASALSRLHMMIARAGFGLSDHHLRDFIADALDAVIQYGKIEGRRGILGVKILRGGAI